MGSDATTRGMVSRALMAEDARWARQQIMVGESVHGALRSVLPLLVSHHIVRIIFEGAKVLESSDPNFGMPDLAAALATEYSSTTEMIRHRSKLLDRKKSSELVLDLLDEVQRAAHETFVTRHRPWVRFLCDDLGIYSLNGFVIGATTPMAFRLGYNPMEERSRIVALATEWGANVELMTLDQVSDSPLTGMPPVPLAVMSQDHRAERYLASRFGSRLEIAEKMLLLMIDGDVNTHRHLLPHVSRGTGTAAFRMRTVSLYHALRSIGKVLQRVEMRAGSLANPLSGVLESTSAQCVLSDAGRMVRNRCVHYRIDDARTSIDCTRPMFGLVEAVFPGMSFEEFYSAVLDCETLLSHALRDWT